MEKKFWAAVCRYCKFWGTIGRTENKNMTQFSLFENEVEPGVVMNIILFFYLQRVHSLIVNMVAEFDHSFLLGQGFWHL